jgi:hypothetical protein
MQRGDVISAIPSRAGGLHTLVEPDGLLLFDTS